LMVPILSYQEKDIYGPKKDEVPGIFKWFLTVIYSYFSDFFYSVD
jgi:hypothetical protein